MQRRAMLLLLSLMLLLTGCRASADERMGEAEGYGGTLRVKVTTSGEDITSVQVVEHHETEGIGTRAIEALPGMIEEADTPDVDDISGATRTSQALRLAVRDAMGMSASPASSPEPTGMMRDTLEGVGMSAIGRVGPGQDDQGEQVYSFNVVFASAQFDREGRIMHVAIDQLEVATPNYDGASMPHFSGFPGQGGYALWDDAAGKTVGHTEDSQDNFLNEISGWRSKRDRQYALPSGSWAEQMDKYEQLFEGKTVDEVEAWFGRLFSNKNGRPLSLSTQDADEQAQLALLTEEEKARLTDMVSSATISLRDSHGDILLALRRAWENAQAAAGTNASPTDQPAST